MLLAWRARHRRSARRHQISVPPVQKPLRVSEDLLADLVVWRYIGADKEQ
jgi:hypothetical protein